MLESKLSSLTHGGQRCYIVVRILRLWDCIIPPVHAFLGIDFLAVDSEGFAMNGFIPPEIADLFRSLLQEGNIYGISIFEVGPRKKKKHLAVPSDDIIYFNISINIQRMVDEPLTFPYYYFSFVCFDELIRRNEHIFHLTDLIGILEGVTEAYSFVLANNKGTVYRRGLFILLQRTAYQESPRYPYYGSSISLLRHSDIEISKGSIHQDTHETTIASLTLMNPTLIKVEPSTLVGLKFKVIARVIRLQHEAGWYYHSCNNCTSGIKRICPGIYTCGFHGPTPPRMNLRVSLIIEHNDIKLQTIVFGDLAYRLTGLNLTILSLAERMNFKKIPAVAEQIIGREYEFLLVLLNHYYAHPMTFKILRFLPLHADSSF
ncbi:Nucleic acid-binding protein [Corchorus olitorius]|uniref:Nucleic acid-binding protein n=1 Tax=Corchorus olitorius TaxID=93759 RepID=A0A1R3KWH7_9ROSI|nr:Nucleic acid-binding protein [Corchorus olitorius]